MCCLNVNNWLFSVLIVSDLRPTLQQLLAMDLPLRVRDKFETFGVFLLEDDRGDRMACIREECRGKPEGITLTVLREWLAGRGVEVTWESLIAALKKSKLQLIAKQIQMALDRLES